MPLARHWSVFLVYRVRHNHSHTMSRRGWHAWAYGILVQTVGERFNLVQILSTHTPFYFPKSLIAAF
ncbi:hypothetical protein A0H81_09443 [Grifola frondosa]|uniref:Uncharacterized protein n=1 Tax=Grifola frondosa TaxID=5627 RepID=A0A1C7M0X2_GRIFR|nr:hypothetical protein A0H81_09443 [Grifola frondosa]